MFDMFELTRFRYVDVKTHSKFEIFSRTQDFANKLIERINKLGVFNLRKAKIFFKKNCYTELPPYEVEQEQLHTVEEWEARKDGTKEIKE